MYRSPDSSQFIHHHCRFRSSGPQRGTFCFSELDTSWLSFPQGQALYRKLQELGLSSNRHSDHDAIMKWFRLFIGVAFAPSAQVTTAFALIKEHYAPNCRGCKEFNLYIFDTWLTGSYHVPIWNQFRAEVPRTNNDCEGYNSRLAKRALKPHLNVYEFILLFRDEQLNKEAYILQIEEGQQPAKRRRRFDHVDSKLHQYGLEYITCERDLHSYLSACSHSVSVCWNYFTMHLCIYIYINSNKSSMYIEFVCMYYYE